MPKVLSSLSLKWKILKNWIHVFPNLPLQGNKPSDTVEIDGADNIIDIFQKLCESKLKDLSQKPEEKRAETSTSQETETPDASQQPAESSVKLIRLYSFPELDDVIAAAHGMNGFFTGDNTLYREGEDGVYQLVLHQSDCTPEEFNKVCNILSEYGIGRAFTPAGEAYFREHCALIADHALQKLLNI